jgi:hypothetical protein
MWNVWVPISWGSGENLLELLDLRERAKQCFEIAEVQNPTEVRLLQLTQAQFYMSEMDRRQSEIDRKHNRRIAWRDVILEVVVIVLIGAEIILAIKQGKDEDKLMDKQNAILTTLQNNSADTSATLKGLLETTNKMNASAGTTAQTLGALKSTTESMSKSVHDQLDAYYDPALVLQFENASTRLQLANNGRTNVIITAVAIDNINIHLDTNRLVGPNTTQHFNLQPFYDGLQNRIEKGTSITVPVRIGLHNELNRKYIFTASLYCIWDKDKVAVYAHASSLEQVPAK